MRLDVLLEGFVIRKILYLLLNICKYKIFRSRMKKIEWYQKLKCITYMKQIAKEGL